MDLLLIYGLCFGASAAAAVACVPILTVLRNAGEEYLNRRSGRERERLDEMFINLSQRKMTRLYAIAPLLVGGLAWLMTERWIAGAVGGAIGLLVPRLLIKYLDKVRRQKFVTQLVDGLLLLSSSLKAGLSMLQAFSVLAEEMPPPISQEFGLVLKEVKMGVDLTEAMDHLKKRMPSNDITLFVTAVLVSRETGGDVTHIFGRLVETLRERNKIKERVKTLTFMTRMQAVIMGMLPFGFSYLVYQMDHNYFQFFFNDPLGRMMLTVIAVLQVIGILLFSRFSRSPI